MTSLRDISSTDESEDSAEEIEEPEKEPVKMASVSCGPCRRLPAPTQFCDKSSSGTCSCDHSNSRSPQAPKTKTTILKVSNNAKVNNSTASTLKLQKSAPNSTRNLNLKSNKTLPTKPKGKLQGNSNMQGALASKRENETEALKKCFNTAGTQIPMPVAKTEPKEEPSNTRKAKVKTPDQKLSWRNSDLPLKNGKISAKQCKGASIVIDARKVKVKIDSKCASCEDVPKTMQKKPPLPPRKPAKKNLPANKLQPTKNEAKTNIRKTLNDRRKTKNSEETPIASVIAESSNPQMARIICRKSGAIEKSLNKADRMMAAKAALKKINKGKSKLEPITFSKVSPPLTYTGNVAHGYGFGQEQWRRLPAGDFQRKKIEPA